MVHGTLEKPYLDNPFQRFHQNIEEYPNFLDDMDDVVLHRYDGYERFKQFEMKKELSAGDTWAIPMEDNDQKFYFFDLQGESIYTNPPDPNQPTIDHGLDEEHIWAFGVTAYNQFLIKNQYATNAWTLSNKVHIPFWGTKLQTPAFYKDEKARKLMRQWNTRLGLEWLKMKHAMTKIKDRQTKH